MDEDTRAPRRTVVVGDYEYTVGATEKLIRTAEGTSQEAEAVARANGKCNGCREPAALRGVEVVPGWHGRGGHWAALCRTCEFAAELDKRDRTAASGPLTRPINIWVSSKLFERIHNGLSEKYGFRSMSSLVRYLMSKYVMDVSRFEDVGQYQDQGSDVKVNVWVPRDIYAVFQSQAQSRGLTVTDALKGLIRMYEMEIEKVVEGRRKETNDVG